MATDLSFLEGYFSKRNAMIEPNQIILKWLDDINNGNIEDLLSLYNERAIVIPTFSNRILNTPQKIREYFEKLQSRKELSIALHANPKIEQKYSEGIYGMSGIYCWRFAVDEELLSFEARFSYIMNLKEKNPILHHHSSQVPRVI
jgi:hypothetical protein